MVRLVLHTHPPRLNLDIRLPEVRLEQRFPRLDVDVEPPAVLIDLSDPLAEIGLKDPLRFARSVKEESRQAALAAIASLAREGDRLAALEEGVTVADVVAMRTTPPVPELNVAALPRSRPRIEARGGVSVRWELGGVQGELLPGGVAVQFVPGTVEITAVDAGVPARVGRSVDARA